MRISESCYSNPERLPERAETDSFNINDYRSVFSCFIVPCVCFCLLTAYPLSSRQRISDTDLTGSAVLKESVSALWQSLKTTVVNLTDP